MKRPISILLVCTLMCSTVLAQTFYSTGFSAGHGWSLNVYNNLNTITEASPGANVWYVSDQESGKNVGDKGGALCGNPTLHLGSSTVGDVGAAYDAGGCGPLIGCGLCVLFGLPCSTTTDRSAVSPNISTVGKTNIDLVFNYIHLGTGLLDNAQIIYSVNGGTTWSLLANMPKTTCCSGAASCGTGCTTTACTGTNQGKWAEYRSTLPASAENITNFRVGLRWTNDNNTVGASDPSVAIDDLILETPVTLPIELLSFNAMMEADQTVKLTWTTATEINNDYFTLFKSEDGTNWREIGEIEGAGNSNEILHYDFDHHEHIKEESYYKLKQTDFDGTYSFSKIIALGRKKGAVQKLEIQQNPVHQVLALADNYQDARIEITNTLGQRLDFDLLGGNDLSTLINVENLSPGIYFVKILENDQIFSGQFMKK